MGVSLGTFSSERDQQGCSSVMHWTSIFLLTVSTLISFTFLFNMLTSMSLLKFPGRYMSKVTVLNSSESTAFFSGSKHLIGPSHNTITPDSALNDWKSSHSLRPLEPKFLFGIDVTKADRETCTEQYALQSSQIFVVYSAFINTMNSNWKILIQLQLENLLALGIPQVATEIFIFLSTHASEENKEHLFAATAATIKAIIPKAVISTNSRNRWEFPAIQKVWLLGQSIPKESRKHSFILYFHSKGMVNNDPSSVRSKLERQLFDVVISPWRDVIQLFTCRPEFNKAGFGKSKAGFVWYNFWWVRVSYVSKLVRPLIVGIEDRHRFYYEQWLSMMKDESSKWPSNHYLGNLFHFKPSGPHDVVALTDIEESVQMLCLPSSWIEAWPPFSEWESSIKPEEVGCAMETCDFNLNGCQPISFIDMVFEDDDEQTSR